MAELAYSSAIEIAKKIRQREISSREALDYFLARIEALDKPINGVVTIDAARAASRLMLRTPRFLAKKFEVLCMACDDHQGLLPDRRHAHHFRAPELSAFIPKEDAWPVARLREAGAIIFGKTNLPIYAGGLQSYNEVFGTTNNPYDVPKTPVAHREAQQRPWRVDLRPWNSAVI